MKRKYDAEWLRGIAELSGWEGVWTLGDEPLVTIPSKEDAAKAMDFDKNDDPVVVAARMFSSIAKSKTRGLTPKLALLAMMVYLGESFFLSTVDRTMVERWLDIMNYNEDKLEKAIREDLWSSPSFSAFDIEILNMANSELQRSDSAPGAGKLMDRLWAYSIAHHTKKTVFDAVKWPS